MAIIDKYVVQVEADTKQFSKEIADIKSQIKGVGGQDTGLKEMAKELKQISSIKVNKSLFSSLQKTVKELDNSIKNFTGNSRIESLYQKLQELEGGSVENQLRDTTGMEGGALWASLQNMSTMDLAAQGLERVTTLQGKSIILSREQAEEYNKASAELNELTEKARSFVQSATAEAGQVKQVTDLLQQLPMKVMQRGNTEEVIGELVKLKMAVEPVKDLSDGLRELYDALSNNIPSFANLQELQSWAMNLSGEGFKKLAEELTQAGIEIRTNKERLRELEQQGKKTKKENDELSESLKKTGESAKKSSSGFQKFLSKIKTMVLYRMVRKALSDIANAFKEGTENLYQYSKATDGVFSGAMDTYSSYALYLKNSLATVIAPLLQSLIPYFKQLVEWIAQAADKVAEFFAALRGDDYYYSAVLAMKQYAAATEEAAQEQKKLKYLISGFDELSIYSSQKTGTSNSSTDAKPSEMFNKVDVSVDTKAFAEKFSVLIGEFKTLGEWLQQNIWPILVQIGEDLIEILSLVNWEVIKQFIEANKALFKSSFEITEAVLSAIGPMLILLNNILMPSLTYLVNGVSNLVSGFGSLLSSLKYFLKAILSMLTFNFDDAWANFGAFGEQLASGILKLTQGVGEVGLSVGASIFAPATLGLSNSVTNALESAMENGVGKLAELLDNNTKEITINSTPVSVMLDGRVIGQSVINWYEEQQRINQSGGWAIRPTP